MSSFSKNEVKTRKSKLYNSRQIRSEIVDPAFESATGILSVPDFLSSRQFEIKSLELAKLRSRYAASTRCFQSLPRKLRRRTASHNVKRIPKRLRSKAIREMQNSTNGVIVNKKSSRGRDLYRIKITKSLLKLGSKLKLLKYLPTSAQSMGDLKIRQKIKFLQQEIKAIEAQSGHVSLSPINNTVGSYDITGINALSDTPRGNLKYCKRQKHFVWLPTHIWHAKRAHLIKRYGYQIPLKPSQKCFKLVNRTSKLNNAAIVYDTSYFNSLILNLKSEERILEMLQKILNKKRISPKILKGLRNYDNWLYIDNKLIGTGLVYVFPEQCKILIRLHPSLYEDFFDHLNNLTQKGSDESIQDCRYALGSIELSGPGSLIMLSKMLHPDTKNKSSDPISNWFKASAFIDNKSIPEGATFSFLAHDPRLWARPTNPPFYQSNLNDIVIDMNDDNSRDHYISIDALEKLMDPLKRNKTYENQPSIKELAKRRTKLSAPIEPTDRDPLIPIIITKLSTVNNWCVVLPWFWVLPFWITLNQQHTAVVGGLNQMHQLNFENYKPTYPVDFPFLPQGYNEEIFKIQDMRKKYDKQSSNTKINFQKLGEICNFFGCDWRYLQLLRYGLKVYSNKDYKSSGETCDGDTVMKDDQTVSILQDMKKHGHSVAELFQLIEQAKLLDEERKARGEVPSIPIKLHNSKRKDVSFNIDSVPLDPLPVVQVRLKLVDKGHPKDGARIYRIPKSEYSTWIRQKPINEEAGHLTSPSPEHLIGFVTSGTFNLNEGYGTGIGCIDAEYARDEENRKKYVLLRNIGTTVPRAAIWEEIKV